MRPDKPTSLVASAGGLAVDSSAYLRRTASPGPRVVRFFSKAECVAVSFFATVKNDGFQTRGGRTIELDPEETRLGGYIADNLTGGCIEQKRARQCRSGQQYP